MTKAELIKAVAEKAEITQKAATQVVDAVFGIVQEAVARGEEVRLPGFGIFVVKDRAARNGRNPQTGEEITIPATKAVVFKAGKELKAAVAK